MTAKIILNPYAGRWKAKEKKPDVISLMNSNKIEFEITETSGPGNGTLLANQAVRDGYDPIIVAGGDGSINEVVNGMMLALDSGIVKNLPKTGILPLGSANDLVVNLGLPVNLEEAVGVIKNGSPKLIDLGLVNLRYFDNNSAIGLEPSITLIQQKIKRIRGTLRYLLATIIGVLKNPSWEIDLEWDGGSYQGPITLVTVGNNPLTGGLFYVTPHAVPDDGQLTFVFGYIPTRLRILQILPNTMRNDEKNYVYHPDIHEINSPWIKIKLKTPSPFHADGEIISTGESRFDFKLIPSCLPIITQ